MGKSNRLSFFYVLTTLGLFLTLIGGGIYGIYISVGLNFARSSVPNIAGSGEVSNVSLAGSVNYTPSMTGIILLSIFLILISIFDFVVMIKQIVFFKQYKLIRNSKLEKKIESKTKSKSSVIFWAIFIDIVSIIAGIVGLFINSRSFAGKSNYSWVFYTVDILVSLFALLSIILLIAKLKAKKSASPTKRKSQTDRDEHDGDGTKTSKTLDEKDINKIEYNLLKLESMKKNKLVSENEYKKIRKKILSFRDNISPKTGQDY